MVEDRARVVAAFHNVAANLLNKDVEINCDVLVTSDDPEARKEVMQLSEDAGCHALSAGVLANSIAAEVFTSILIHINKTYKTGHAGIKITGL
jgi:predicted dinucleotide-binding enzyme